MLNSQFLLLENWSIWFRITMYNEWDFDMDQDQRPFPFNDRYLGERNSPTSGPKNCFQRSEVGTGSFSATSATGAADSAFPLPPTVMADSWRRYNTKKIIKLTLKADSHEYNRIIVWWYNGSSYLDWGSSVIRPTWYNVPSARPTLHSTKLCTKFKIFRNKIFLGTKVNSEVF